MDNQIFQQILYYANGIWRRRWWVVVVAWFVCVAGWTYVSTMPDYYESSARIYVDTSNILRPLLSGITVDDNIENEISFIQRTLTSRPNVEKIARMTDLDIQATSRTDMERMLDRIEAGTTIVKQGENLFHITYRAPDPELAKNVVQSYLTLFVESNLGQSRQDRDSAREFLDEQIREYEKQLTEAEMRLAKFKQENAGLLPGERGFEANLNNARDMLGRANEEYLAAINKREALQLQLKEIPETIEVSSGYIGSGGPPSPIAVRILELEAEIERLLQQYTSEHPDVKAAQRRLDALRAERDADLRAIATGVGGQEEANTSTYSIANKVYEQVKLNLVEVETDIQIMKERLERANERVGRLESRAAQVPEVEAALTRLNRDYTVVKKNHDALLDRRESARLSRARELKAEEVQFRVVEPPVVPTLPSGPPRGLFIIATIVVGIGAGVGVSGLLFVISGAISSVVGLKEQFRVPVFGVVSVVDSLASRRLKPLKVFACFGTLVLLFVACGALLLIEQQYGLANFVPRDLVGTTRWL